jgi:hypothetical protein
MLVSYVNYASLSLDALRILFIIDNTCKPIAGGLRFILLWLAQNRFSLQLFLKIKNKIQSIMV